MPASSWNDFVCCSSVKKRTNFFVYSYFLYFFYKNVVNELHTFWSSADNLKNVQGSVDRTNPTDVAERTPLIDLYPTQMPHPRTKIKLQLFPINEKTRMALEKVLTRGQNIVALSTDKYMISVFQFIFEMWQNYAFNFCRMDIIHIWNWL